MDVSIANLPAFVGTSADTGDLLVMVDVSDTSESPLGTTKRMSWAQASAGSLTGPVNINAAANGDALVATYSGSGSNVGPGFKLVRTSATPRTWQLRVGIDGSYEVADLTAPATRFSIATNGATSVNGNLMVTAAANVLALTNTAAAAATNVYAIFQRGSNISTYFFANASDDFVIARSDGVASATINRLTGNWTFAAGGTTSFGAISAASIGVTTISAIGPLIIGTDPGGTALLRVGGNAIVNQTLTLGQAVPTANGVAIINFFGSNTQVNWRLGYQQSVVGGLEFARSTAAGGTAFAAPLLVLNPDSTVVIGADPGTTRMLRVGGGAFFTQRFSVQGAIPADVAGDFYNSSSSGYGVQITGGNATNYALDVHDYTNVVLFTVNATKTQSTVPVVVGTDLGGAALLRVTGPGAATFTAISCVNNRNVLNDATLIELGDSFRARGQIAATNLNTGNNAGSLVLRVGIGSGTSMLDALVVNFNGHATHNSLGNVGCYLYLHDPGAGPSAQQIIFEQAGVNKWQLGKDVTAGPGSFDLYDGASGAFAFRIAPSTRQAVFTANVVTGFAMQVINTNTAPSGLDLFFNSAAPNNVTALFLSCHDNAPAVRCNIRSNGGIENFQANNFNLSDASLKDVGALLDPHVWWDRLAALEIRAFKYLDQTHDDDNIGLIAQQVQAVAPELVDEIAASETSPALLGVYTTDLYHAHIAVTQELQRRILALEAKLA